MEAAADALTRRFVQPVNSNGHDAATKSCRAQLRFEILVSAISVHFLHPERSILGRVQGYAGMPSPAEDSLARGNITPAKRPQLQISALLGHALKAVSPTFTARRR